MDNASDGNQPASSYERMNKSMLETTKGVLEFLDGLLTNEYGSRSMNITY